MFDPAHAQQATAHTLATGEASQGSSRQGGKGSRSIRRWRSLWPGLVEAFLVSNDVFEGFLGVFRFSHRFF